MLRSVLKSLVLCASLIALPALAVVPDGLITSKAKMSLWTTAGIRSTTVHVDTNDGVITLYGTVPTPEQKALAGRTAHDLDGVRDVNNLIQVVAVADEKRVERTDKDLRTLAEKALKADAELKDSTITVKSVDKGVVLLTGSAKTFSDHLRSVVIVDRLPGVRRVASEVKSPDAFGNDERVSFMVDPAAKPAPRDSASDMRISSSVKMRLLTAAEVPSMEISVDTDQGIVTLFGIVPTADIKAAAGNEAGKATGVVSVQNQLEVVGSAQKKTVDAKDADITRDLVLAYKDRPELRNVTNTVKNGTVRLTGTVGSSWDEVNAVRLARRINGVRGVENQLKVDEKIETTQR
jgi:hyperosmotically inducible protein